jgi:tetratricopeptide (TPR) repeat protein
MAFPRHFFIWCSFLVTALHSQETSANDMWKLLQRSSIPEVEDTKSEFPPIPDTPSDFETFENSSPQKTFLQDLLSRSEKVLVTDVKLNEENISFSFSKNGKWSQTSMPENHVNIYTDESREITFVIVCLPLAKDTKKTKAEIYEALKNNHTKSLKIIDAPPKTEHLNFEFREGYSKLSSIGRVYVRSGYTVQQGAAYSIAMVGKDKPLVEREFDQIFQTLDWIDKKRNLDIPMIANASLPAAGISMDSGKLELIPTANELLDGITVRDVARSIEISGIDIGTANISLKELSQNFISILNFSQSGKFKTKEFLWDEKEAIEYTSTEPFNMLSSATHWRIAFTKHHNLLLIAYDTQPALENAMRPPPVWLNNKFVFSKPPGSLLDPMDPVQRNTLASFHNQTGLSQFEKGRYDIAAPFFEKSFLLKPTSATALINWINALHSLGKGAEALKVLTKYEAIFEGHHEIKLWKAGLSSQNGKPNESVALYEELFQEGLRDQAEISLWMQTLQSIGNAGRASQIAEQIFRETNSPIWQRIFANALWVEEKLNDSATQYEALQAEYGEEAQFVEDHCSLRIQMEDYTAALKLIENWESNNNASATLLFNKGIALSGLGKFKEAVVVLTKVNDLIPGNQTVRESLAQAQAMMGRGTLDGVRDDLQPIAVPENISLHAKEALDSIGLATKYPGEAWIIREQITLWEWKQGTNVKTTCRQVIEILDTPGIQSFSKLTIPFKGYSERVNVNSLNVLAQDGKLIAKYNRDEIYVQDEAGALANGNKILTIPVPSLSKGVLIEFIYTKELSATEELFPMVMEIFPESTPLVYSAVVFTGDLDKIRFDHRGAINSSCENNLKIYEAKHLQKRHGSTYLPRYDSWGMLCWAADTRISWQSEATDYLEEIRTYLDDSDFAKRVVAELELTQKNERDKLRTIVRWMNKNFRYQGLEFGRRARIPASGSATVSRGFGDCKDFSIMLRAILKEAGFNAEIALVNSLGIVNEDLPSLDQFDHMIVYISDDKEKFLDGTLFYFNTPEALSPSAIGTKAFLPESNPPKFVSMSEPASAYREASIKRDVEIDTQTGDIAVIETTEISPAFAWSLRYGYSQTAAADYVRTTENLLRQYTPNLELQDAKIDNLEDPFSPLIFKLRYRISSALKNSDGSWNGSIPFPFEKWLFELRPERDRRIGLTIHASEALRSITNISIPKDHTWQSSPSELLTFEPDVAFAGSVTTSESNNVISLSAKWEVKPCDDKAEKYHALSEANSKLFDAMNLSFQFKKTSSDTNADK